MQRVESSCLDEAAALLAHLGERGLSRSIRQRRMSNGAHFVGLEPPGGALLNAEASRPSAGREVLYIGDTRPLVPTACARFTGSIRSRSVPVVSSDKLGHNMKGRNSG